MSLTIPVLSSMFCSTRVEQCAPPVQRARHTARVRRSGVASAGHLGRAASSRCLRRRKGSHGPVFLDSSCARSMVAGSKPRNVRRSKAFAQCGVLYAGKHEICSPHKSSIVLKPLNARIVEVHARQIEPAGTVQHLATIADATLSSSTMPTDEADLQRPSEPLWRHLTQAEPA